MTTTTDEVKETAEEVRDNFNFRIIGNCRTLASKLENELNKKGINAELVSGKINGEVGLGTHYYVKIDSSSLSDTDSECIVDISMSQFTQENYYEYNLETYLSLEDIPDVGVWTTDEEEYHLYE